MVHIREILSEVKPVIRRRSFERNDRGPGRSFDEFELTWNQINWDSVPSINVFNDVRAVPRPETSQSEGLDVDGFDAIWAEMDLRTTIRDLFVTESATYVPEVIRENSDSAHQSVSDEDLRAAAGTALSEMSVKGYLEGLHPCEDIAPSRSQVIETADLDDRVEAIDITDGRADDSFIPFVVPKQDADHEEVRRAVRTTHGVTYPRPKRIEIVSDESEFPST